MYLTVNIALVVKWAKLRRRDEHKSFLLWILVPVIGVAVPVWRDLRPSQAGPYNTLPWLTLALVTAGFIYQLILGAVRPPPSRWHPRY